MTRPSWSQTVLGAVVVVAAALGAPRLNLWSQPSPASAQPITSNAAASASSLPVRGGALVATLRSEPRSFNPHAGRDFASSLVATLTQASLVRINRATQQVEPWLAERYACAADGLSCTLTLRPGLTFSDGTPVTVADVLFSFEVMYDTRTGSARADDMSPGGKPIVVTAPDARTIVVRFAVPFGPGVRILDVLPILPRHKLAAALAAGTLRSQWGPTTRPGAMAGLGPFVLQEYRSGERLVFVRNPHYWRTDAAGTALPYLDRLTLEIVPDQNAELLRLQAGQADLTQSEIRADDYAVLKREATAGKLRLIDAGVGLDADAFWFNLKPEAKAGDPRRAWLQSLALRQAVSYGVDRATFVNTVFLGAAVPQWGPVTPSNTVWTAPAGVVERHPFDPAKARVLLGQAGLRDTNRDGQLEDGSGQPARFSIITQKGNTALEKGAAVIGDDLRKLGLTVDVVPLEVGALVDRMSKGQYDALYFRFLTIDTDPVLAMDFWLSSGGAHVWNMEQATPATPWEQGIDDAMRQMVAARDLAVRQRLFSQAQKLLSDNLPVVYFAAPRLYVAVSTRVMGVQAAPTRPLILWNADSIGIGR
jgi:peptide/nickel transport system substrate-binding protein